MFKVCYFRKLIILLFVIAFAFAGIVQGADSTKIDLNKATVQELVKLKGIGKKFAERIVEYRKNNGKFTKIDDLLKVKGIGQKKFEAIKDLISVETGK